MYSVLSKPQVLKGILLKAGKGSSWRFFSTLKVGTITTSKLILMTYRLMKTLQIPSNSFRMES